MKPSNIAFPCDPIIEVIAADVRANRALKRAVRGLKQAIVPHRNTLHPSDALLNAWYRFKENQTCPR